MERMNGILGIVVSSVALLVVVLVGWFVFVSPQRSKADRLGVQVDAAKSELSADEALLAPNTRKLTQSAALAAERALPDDVRMPAILRELNGFAKISRTEIDNISPGSAVALGGATAIPISFQFKGRYFGLQKLLELLRKNADVRKGEIVSKGRLYTVDSIAFQGGQSTTNAAGQAQATGDISATIAVNAFTYGGTLAAPAATTTTTETTTAAAPAG